ncbi:hypothetical protein BX666DRAFT_1935478 [Dichotomocladium elegans]|nr:hypothetical protein BX666DRAFT_1935478 [Dichotomocladium elegans]
MFLFSFFNLSQMASSPTLSPSRKRKFADLQDHPQAESLSLDDHQHLLRLLNAPLHQDPSWISAMDGLDFLAPPSSILPSASTDDCWSFLLDNTAAAEEDFVATSPSSSFSSMTTAATTLPPPLPEEDEAAINDVAIGNEYTVMIMTGRVAQKSYGTEKRFLCPPPTTVLLGPTTSATHHPVYIKADGGPSQTVSLEPTAEGYLQSVSRHLHVTEKRKLIRVSVDIPRLGTFYSNPIKVISKPSKKRQSSMKHLELCIHHGSTIALFNRIRSQTVSTKYLGVNTANTTCLDFVAQPNAWDPFLIWAADGQAGPLHYNQRVHLQSVKTGLRSPVLIIRRSKVNGSQACATAIGNNDDPISQMHRIVLEFAESPGSFLGCVSERVLVVPMEATDDSVIWTVIGTDCTTYRFRTLPTLTNAETGVTPFPTVRQAVVVDDIHRTLKLEGTHLGDHLQVWLGDIQTTEVETTPEGGITCRLPTSDILLSSPLVVIEEENNKLPIMLVRAADGTMYQTGHYYRWQ